MSGVETLKHEHLDAVLAIERACYPDPWTRSMFEDELSASGRCYFVWKEGEDVVAFLGMSDLAGVIHVTNLATAHHFRRRGIAKTLLGEVAPFARARGAKSASLEVRVSNRVARRLYESCGFAPAGIRKGYYQDREDALIMWCTDLQRLSPNKEPEARS